MQDLNPKNNQQKQNDIVQLWYALTGKKFEKVNLATNDEVANSVPAGTREYINEVKRKDIPLVWEHDIDVRGDKNLHIVFLHDFNLYDMSNPQKGVDDASSFKAIKSALANKNPNDKTLVFFSGDIIGKEFNITSLQNASIENRKILFWGLQKRVNKLIDYLEYVAKNGADEIILMNGRDEHQAKRKLNRDILKDALLDEYNKVLLSYAVNKTNGKSKRVKMSYVPGVKKVFNIKRTVDGKVYYYDISIHTNLKTTSRTMEGNKRAAVNQHGELAKADYIFVPSENAVGSYSNVIFSSGLARYKDATRSYVPTVSTKGYNSFTLVLGNENHKMEIARSTQFINPQTYGLEKKQAKLENEVNVLAQICKNKIDEALKNYYNNQPNFKNLVDKEKGE